MDDLQTQQKSQPLFTNRALLLLIIPLVIERFLDMAVGMADSVMVAAAGEAAVSAVSLVDNINNLVINVLAALATGGAVVISQYLGREDPKNARTASKQLLYTMILVSSVLTGIFLAFRDPLLRMILGELEPAVLENCRSYFFITSLSFPFIAIFNAIAALYRSMGNSRTSMLVSLGMNTLNIIGNAVFIYGFGWGVAGAAASSLISRVIASAALLFLIRDHRNTLYLSRLLHVRFNPKMIKNILRVGIPSGLENGVFHIGRLAVQNLVATFGTAAIAANAIAGRVGNIAYVPGSAIALAIITVVGQCVGAGDYKQAQGYVRRMMALAYALTALAMGAMFLLSPQAAAIFNLSSEATAMSVELMRMSAVVSAIVWPMSFTFPNVLRAAGDVKFAMIVSIASMCVVRIGFSYLFEYAFGLGLVGTWYAMFLDWVVRVVCFVARYASGKWKQHAVI